MAKKVTEVPVEINELALSLLGWEVQDFRARVTTERYDDGDCFDKLAVSGVFRFNDADWVEGFSFSSSGASGLVCYCRARPLPGDDNQVLGILNAYIDAFFDARRPDSSDASVPTYRPAENL